MRPLVRALKAERIRLVRSWPLLVAVLLPLVVVVFLGLIYYHAEDRVAQAGRGAHTWYRILFQVWTFFGLPAGAALMGVLSHETDAQARAAKLVGVQPIPRGTWFMAKGLSLQGMLAGASVLLTAGALIAAGLFRALSPNLGVETLEGPLLVNLALSSLAVGTALGAFHAWLPSRWRGFGSSLGLALAGFWGGLRAPAWLGWVWPWTGTAQLLEASSGGSQLPLRLLAMSLGCALVWVAVGTWDASHREWSVED